MTAIHFEVFDAFKAAGVPEENARRAAESLSEAFSAQKEVEGIQTDVKELKKDVNALQAKTSLLQWMLGVNIALSTAVLVRLLIG